MAYIEGRVVHDADAHIMETPNWLRDFADPAVRDKIDGPSYSNELAQTGDGDHGGEGLDEIFARLAERHGTSEFLDGEAEEVMTRKNFAATGSFIAEDRPRVLDFIGVASQLLFNTLGNFSERRHWLSIEVLPVAISPWCGTREERARTSASFPSTATLRRGSPTTPAMP